MIDVKVKHTNDHIAITARHGTDYADFETTKVFEHGSDKHSFVIESAVWKDSDKFLSSLYNKDTNNIKIIKRNGEIKYVRKKRLRRTAGKPH